MGRKDLGHLNITCVIRREKAIKGDQEGIAADVGWGGRTRQLVSLTSRDNSMKKKGTGQLCHKLPRGQERRKSDSGWGRVTDDLNNGGWELEDRFWSGKE